MSEKVLDFEERLILNDAHKREFENAPKHYDKLFLDDMFVDVRRVASP